METSGGGVARTRVKLSLMKMFLNWEKNIPVDVTDKILEVFVETVVPKKEDPLLVEAVLRLSLKSRSMPCGCCVVPKRVPQRDMLYVNEFVALHPFIARQRLVHFFHWQAVINWRVQELKGGGIWEPTLELVGCRLEMTHACGGFEANRSCIVEQSVFSLHYSTYTFDVIDQKLAEELCIF